MQKILLTALIAGFVAGLVSFGIQQVKLVPLILQAETYEVADTDQPSSLRAEGEAIHEHKKRIATSATPPRNDENPDLLKRTALTLLADIGVGVGYALLLAGAMALRGGKIDVQKGILWGIAGFASFSLAPAFGLAPELPTTLAADLYARQIWWMATVLSTAGGLALVAFAPKNFTKLAGVVLILVPHVIGAPEPAVLGGAVPTELNAKFAAASLGVAAVFWLVLGTAIGWLHGRNTANNIADNN